MCRYCWETPMSREERDWLYPREEIDQSHRRAMQRFLDGWDSNPPEWWDEAVEYRELSWEATPDYDALMERGDDEVAEEGDWGVWLAEGERRVPNG